MESDAPSGTPGIPLQQRLANLSHDLKSPLTSLKMAIHLLQEDPTENLTPSQRELIASAAEDVERLQSLIIEHLAKPRA